MDFIAQKDLISGLAIFYAIKQHPWRDANGRTPSPRLKTAGR
jgi:hypothetical protein